MVPTPAQQQQTAPNPAASAAVQPTEWFQKTITLPQLKRGCHVITRKILAELPEVTEFEIGLANLFSEWLSAGACVHATCVCGGGGQAVVVGCCGLLWAVVRSHCGEGEGFRV